MALLLPAGGDQMSGRCRAYLSFGYPSSACHCLLQEDFFFFAMELHEVIPLVVAERQAPLSLSGLVSNTNGWTEELLFDSGDQQLLFRSCRQQRVTAELNGTWCVSIWWKARSWRDLEGSFLQRNQTHL